jgi:hypothetical protein
MQKIELVIAPAFEGEGKDIQRIQGVG